jgi:cysteinyl-tRNA synthetase
LEFDGYKVKEVMNITDVGHLTSDGDTGEDKLERAAKKNQESVWEVAQRYTDAFVSDIEKLNIQLPDMMPRATDHIDEQIQIIKKLEEKGFTYKTSDGIYFDTSKFPDYGKMARLNLEGQKAGARVEENAEKKSPYDFALWKFSRSDEKRQMEWESPWGVGYPGWHIECSAMSTKYLGQPFDIHTGGIDHIPVHHTNEIAQSEAAYGKPLANCFLHSEFLLMGQDKMSKSLGNITTLVELEKTGYEPSHYRYLTLTAHYRSKLSFSFDALDSARNALGNLREDVSSYPEPGEIDREYLAKFQERVDDDLDMPGALAVMWGVVKSDLPNSVKAATLFKFDEVLGLGLQDSRVEIPAEVQRLIDEREKAREEKDFAKSDELRAQIEERGFGLRDTEDRTVWFKKAG